MGDDDPRGLANLDPRGMMFLDKKKQNNEISECDFERNLDIIKIMVHSNLCVNWN